MKRIGLDIGSRTVKMVLLEDNKIIETRKEINSFDPLKIAENIMEDYKALPLVVTGYGRNLFNQHYQCKKISEIKAFADGAYFLNPNIRTILDIGGQDTKVITLNENGKMTKFEMNDKCSAGTGRFLEIMSMALGYTLEEFSKLKIDNITPLMINSMCTVFAESEVISTLAKGAKREAVASGLMRSVVKRAVGMMKKVGIKNDIMFAGGVAFNEQLVRFLNDELKTKVFIADDPQIVGALGAALNADE